MVHLKSPKILSEPQSLVEAYTIEDVQVDFIRDQILDFNETIEENNNK